MATWKVPLFLYFIFFLHMVSLSISQVEFINYLCSSDSQNNTYNDKNIYADNSTYEKNLHTLLSSAASNTQLMDYGFYNHSSGQNPDKVNAMALCRGDVPLKLCQSCVHDATGKIVQVCPNQKVAIVWYNQCMFRYSNSSIFGVMNNLASQSISSGWVARNSSEFIRAVKSLLQRLGNEASSGDSTRKFATGKEITGLTDPIYALVQCTPDLSSIDCSNCIGQVANSISTAIVGVRNFTASCFLRYENFQFYSSSTPTPDDPRARPKPPRLLLPPTEGTGKKNVNTRVVIVVITVLSVVGCWVLIICIYVFQRTRKREKFSNEASDEISILESLQFDFNTIRNATDGFSEANKLGQGGFGIVYKGRLINGQEIAVKRLSQDSEQGDSEFKNELLLVAKLQHRNLVRLLGFCLDRNERHLVYELVSNSSLDRFIFDPVRSRYLDWMRRYRIITGITRGLLYLHEESRLKIIHRDLKASNVLLDAELFPKISDFGMARLFSIDQSQGNTSKIVGTYGYMAPEYAMHGRFSVKADVFSYGVLLLEILSGRKNSSLRDGEDIEHLLSYAWKNWREGTIENVIDPTLNRAYVDEIIRCIHIGLLCVQENASNRPTMGLVDMMFNSKSLNLPMPSQPAFLLHSDASAVPPLLISDSEEASLSTHQSSNAAIHPQDSINQVSLSDLEPR